MGFPRAVGRVPRARASRTSSASTFEAFVHCATPPDAKKGHPWTSEAAQRGIIDCAEMQYLHLELYDSLTFGSRYLGLTSHGLNTKICIQMSS